MKFMIIVILPIVLLIEGLVMAQTQQKQDLETIANRLRSEFSGQAPREDHIQSRLESQNTDGSWPNVDYGDVSRTHWSPYRHTRNLSDMACAYGAKDHALGGSAALREGILNGLTFWVHRDPQSDNWWFNAISTSRDLGRVLLIMGDAITDDVRDKTAVMIRRSGFTRTGSNLTWEANNLMVLACALGDEAGMQEAIDYLTREIKITTEEGIQSDYSFHQHGPQLYMSNYGSAFSGNNSRYCVLFAGTSFALSDKKIAAISGLVREGQQWFLWGRQFDYHALGRQLDNPGATWRGREFIGISDRMVDVDPENADEYRQFSERLKGNVPPGETGPKGNRHYWRSDTMVHRPREFYVSVRMHSTRTYATETRTNRENLKGYHLSDGAYFLMQRGDEFHVIQPTWDWRKLPGVTFRDTDDPYPYGRLAPRGGNTDFVGGASDGQVGVAAMDYAKDDVLAHKSWFFFDQGFVCLGAGIAAEKDESVTTALNQTLLNGEVLVLKGQRKEMNRGRLAGKNITAVYHDGVGYYLLGEQQTVVRADAQTGTWTSIEEDSSREDPVTQDVFNLWIDHGVRPQDGNYGYAVIPGVDGQEFEALSDDLPFQGISNTSSSQAVFIPGLDVVQSAFFEAGTVVMPNGQNLTVDLLCLMIIRISGKKITLSVSDPTQEMDQIQMHLSGSFEGSGCVVKEGVSELTVDLPQDEWSGKTVTIELVNLEGT
jgi:chondroitin AC lyase